MSVDVRCYIEQSFVKVFVDVEVVSLDFVNVDEVVNKRDNSLFLVADFLDSGENVKRKFVSSFEIHECVVSSEKRKQHWAVSEVVCPTSLLNNLIIIIYFG